MAEVNELATALNKFQAELVTVGKDKKNPFFKSSYADLASIMLEAQPVLTKHGLSVVQLLDNLDGKPALTTILLHTSGQNIQATIPLILSKEDPQGVGSSVTYMRRYGYAAALQIVIDEDDDGNRASRPQPARAPVNTSGATEAQRTAINNWLDKHGIEAAEKQNYLVNNYHVTMPLSKTDAAVVIESMVLGDSA